jgi:hypothetical protein
MVLGHTDFDTIVVASEDRDLTRRVLRTYTDLPVMYRHMARRRADGPAVARADPRQFAALQAIHAHTTVLPSSEPFSSRRPAHPVG